MEQDTEQDVEQDADSHDQWCEEYYCAVPDGFYPCRGNERWCAITVKNEKDWKAFCRILGEPELELEKFSSTAARKENIKALDIIVRRWTSARSAESIVDSLQEAGIAAGVVQTAEDISKDKQLESRNFFVSLKHSILGETVADRSALWPWRQETVGWRAAPLLGEADHDIFVKRLGMSGETFRAFIRQGIIG